MKALAYLHRGEPRHYAALLAGLATVDVAVVVADPGERVEAALAGLCPLGFAGALVEGDDLLRRAASGLLTLEPEAREAGRVDALVCDWSGPRGLYLAPAAMAQLLAGTGYPGLRALWIGRPRPELAPGLRGVGRVDVAAGPPADGEAFLGRLSPAVRGEVAVRPDEVRAVAARADLVIYAGGGLPLDALAPYHTLLALAPVPPEAADLVEAVVGPERYHAEWLALAIREILGIALPADAFLDL